MLLLFTFVAAALFIDQFSKRAVENRVIEPVLWGPLLRIRKVRHCERLYLQAAWRNGLLSLWHLALVSAVCLHGSGLYLRSPLAVMGMGCALGGAAGNLMDILRQGNIVDFIDLGWWPVFNLADVAIVGGLLLAFSR